MRTKLKFTRFNRHKDIDELVYEVSHWTSTMEFIKFELDFIKNLLKLYPFKKNIINLFERIQLYLHRIGTFETTNTTISESLHEYELSFDRMKENNNRNDIAPDLTKHENLAEEIFDHQQTYTAFKREVYEYIDSIIK